VTNKKLYLPRSHADDKGNSPSH